MEGLIFSIKKYSIHDGPGIRVTFFMKGCPLSCLWCHNPEGISPYPETVTQTRIFGEKEISREEVVGKFYSPEAVIEIADKERVFLNNSGGGVTFSGGEPLLQFEFLIEALKLCKRNGYHTALDTSGYAHSENLKAILPYTDLFLFDLKHMDDEKHSALTGVSREKILRNWFIIMESGRDIMVRIPIIPGLNDDISNLEQFKKFIKGNKSSSIKMINILPFHRIGSSKYKRFNIPYLMGEIKQPSKARMNELEDFFADTGIKVKSGG